MRALILLVVLTSLPAPAAETQWGLGLGMESRLEREVNPDYGDLRNAGQLFVKLRLAPWSFLAEGSDNARESSSGSLSVRSQTTTVMIWPRYEFDLGSPYWAPFLATGLGMNFDQVRTKFQTATDTRNGTRGIFGLGGGVIGTFWKRWQLEGEFRARFVENTKDPEISGVIRGGVLL